MAAVDGSCIKGIKMMTNKGRTLSVGDLAGAVTVTAPAGAYLQAFKGKSNGKLCSVVAVWGKDNESCNTVAPVAKPVEKPAPAPVPEPEPMPEPMPEPTPEPTPAPEPTPEPVAVPAPEPVPAPVPETKPAPVAATCNEFAYFYGTVGFVGCDTASGTVVATGFGASKFLGMKCVDKGECAKAAVAAATTADASSAVSDKMSSLVDAKSSFLSSLLNKTGRKMLGAGGLFSFASAPAAKPAAAADAAVKLAECKWAICKDVKTISMPDISMIHG